MGVQSIHVGVFELNVLQKGAFGAELLQISPIELLALLDTTPVVARNVNSRTSCPFFTIVSVAVVFELLDEIVCFLLRLCEELPRGG